MAVAVVSLQIEGKCSRLQRYQCFAVRQRCCDQVRGGVETISKGYKNGDVKERDHAYCQGNRFWILL